MASAATDLSCYRRRYPSLFPLSVFGYICPKYQWVSHAFGTCNFSLILRGQGEYRGMGARWDVQAPCVIVQWPGELVEYGPSGSDGTWDEYYFIYGAELASVFRARRLLDPAEPVWPIRNLPAVESLVQAIVSLAASPAPAQAADRLDRICEQLILETYLQPSESVADDEEAAAIRLIECELASDLDQEIDLDELAARHGMSPRTFRRRWAKKFSAPPGHYRMKARMREARKLLAETTRPVSEIARVVGFVDELYFSRRFHDELNMSPRAFRNMCQKPTSTIGAEDEKAVAAG